MPYLDEARSGDDFVHAAIQCALPDFGFRAQIAWDLIVTQTMIRGHPRESISIERGDKLVPKENCRWKADQLQNDSTGPNA